MLLKKFDVFCDLCGKTIQGNVNDADIETKTYVERDNVYLSINLKIESHEETKIKVKYLCKNCAEIFYDAILDVTEKCPCACAAKSLTSEQIIDLMGK